MRSRRGVGGSLTVMATSFITRYTSTIRFLCYAANVELFLEGYIPKQKRTNNVVSALTARTQLGQIMKRAAEQNERFVVDRRGEPTIVIMSLRDYIDTVAPAPQWLKDIQAEAKRKGLDKLKMRDINRIIAEVRSDRRKARPTKPAAK